MNLADAERDKYERVWQHDDYGKLSPGERMAGHFIDIVRPKGTVIDFGCGAGKGTRALVDAGLDVIGVDHVLHADFPKDDALFMHACLWRMGDYSVMGDVGYCVDVMEHIPPEMVGLTLARIMEKVPECFFQISTRPDQFGKLVGEPLHLTVKQFPWWLKVMDEIGIVTDARDFMTSCMFVVERRA